MLIVRSKGLNSILCNISTMNFKNNIEIYLKFCSCRVTCILFHNFFLFQLLSSEFTLLSLEFTLLSSDLTLLSSEFTILSSEFTLQGSHWTPSTRYLPTCCRALPVSHQTRMSRSTLGSGYPSPPACTLFLRMFNYFILTIS